MSMLEPRQVYNVLNVQPRYFGLEGAYIFIGLGTFLLHLFMLTLGIVFFVGYFILWLLIYALLLRMSDQLRKVRVGYVLKDRYLV